SITSAAAATSPAKRNSARRRSHSPRVRPRVAAQRRIAMTERRPPREILRYSANERTNRWLLAVGSELAGRSGLALYHPAVSWVAARFGGGPWTRILHPFIGVFMFVVFFLFAARMWGSNRIDARDRQWLRQIDDVAAGREDRLPEVGRYNAGQK